MLTPVLIFVLISIFQGHAEPSTSSRPDECSCWFTAAVESQDSTSNLPSTTGASPSTDASQTAAPSSNKKSSCPLDKDKKSDESPNRSGDSKSPANGVRNVLNQSSNARSDHSPNKSTSSASTSSTTSSNFTADTSSSSTPTKSPSLSQSSLSTSAPQPTPLTGATSPLASTVQSTSKNANSTESVRNSVTLLPLGARLATVNAEEIPQSSDFSATTPLVNVGTSTIGTSTTPENTVETGTGSQTSNNTSRLVSSNSSQRLEASQQEERVMLTLSPTTTTDLPPTDNQDSLTWRILNNGRFTSPPQSVAGSLPPLPEAPPPLEATPPPPPSQSWEGVRFLRVPRARPWEAWSAASHSASSASRASSPSRVGGKSKPLL